VIAATDHKNRDDLPVDRSVLQVQGNYAAALPAFHQQIHGKVFDEVIAVVAQRLTIERVQKRVTGSVDLKEFNSFGSILVW